MRHLTLILILCITMPVNALAAGSAPSSSKGASEEIQLYNEGVDLMLSKKVFLAEMKFRKSLDMNDNFAQAHNNLAYVLRKQGPSYYQQAMEHYTTAIGISPELDEPYMYRGVLQVQMGDMQGAKQDHSQLDQMNSPLAEELAYVIDNGREKQPEQFLGVSPEVR